MRMPSLTTRILIGLLAGIGIGYFVPDVATQLKPLSDIFLHLIKMIVVPLIFGSLARRVGARATHTRSRGERGYRTGCRVGSWPLTRVVARAGRGRVGNRGADFLLRYLGDGGGRSLVRDRE